MSPVRSALVLLSLALALGCAAAPHGDPLFADPAVDLEHPALLWEGGFQSGGERVNAIAYQASGAGPHPTAVLLHGFPGNERNLDLAQALRRAGWNVVFFHYRGAWGSGGSFSIGNVLDDIHAVVSAVRDPVWAREHRVDPERIALVGHSMGGFASLVAGAENDQVGCIAALAAANLGGLREGQDDPAAIAATARALDGWLEGRITGTSGAALVAEIGRGAERFDVLAHADSLAGKRVLLVSGSRDEVVPLDALHRPLTRALALRGAAVSESVVLDADHSFSSKRIALAGTVTRFLEHHCAGSR